MLIPPGPRINPCHGRSHFTAAEKRVIQYVKTDRISDAHQILLNMRENHEIPSIVMYNDLIKAYSKKSTCSIHRQKAQELLNEMIESNVQPSSQTYLQLALGEVAAFEKTGCTQQFITWFDALMSLESQRIYRRHRTRFKIKSLLERMIPAQHPSVPHVVHLALDRQVVFDADMWHLAITGCALSQQWSGLERLMTHPQRPEHLGVATYEEVIKAYLRVQDFDHATALFRTMLDQGIVASPRIYASFLRAYSQQPEDRCDMLQRLWNAMITVAPADVEITDSLVMRVLKHYVRHGAYPEAERLYWEMRHRGRPLSHRSLEFMYTIVSGFASRLELISSMSLFYDVLSQNVWPRNDCVVKLINVCAARSDVPAARQVVDLLDTLKSRHNVTHLPTSWLEALVCAYARIGDDEQASEMFATMQATCDPGHLPPKATEVMMTICFRSGDVETASQLWQQSPTIDKDVLVEGFARLGRWQDAEAYTATPPTPRQCRILVQAHIEYGDLSGAENQLERALQDHAPTSIVGAIQAVLGAWAVEGNVSQCERWLKVLSDAEVDLAQAHDALQLAKRLAASTTPNVPDPAI